MNSKQERTPLLNEAGRMEIDDGRKRMEIDDARKQNAFLAECMMIMTSILHLGRSGYAKKQIPEDDFTRISACVKVKFYFSLDR